MGPPAKSLPESVTTVISLQLELKISVLWTLYVMQVVYKLPPPLLLPILFVPLVLLVLSVHLVLLHVQLVLQLLVLQLVLLTHVPVLPTVVLINVILLLQSRKLALPVPWIPVPRNPSYQQVVVIPLNLLVQLLLAVASLLPILPQLDLLPLSWLSLPLLDFKL